MIVLGLDPSLTGFGWCVHNGGVAGQGRVVAKGQFKTPASRNIYWRYQYLREAICHVIDNFPEIEAVGAESPPFGEGWSEGLYGLFLYVNEAVMRQRLDIVYFDPLRAKLLAKMDPNVRRGSMDKGDMIDAAKQDTGISRWNHNEADAYIIGRSAARFWDRYHDRVSDEELTPAEVKVFLNIHTFTRGKKAGKTIGTGILFKEGDRFYRFSQIDEGELSIELPPVRKDHGSSKSQYHRTSEVNGSKTEPSRD